jgi:MFS transporter, MCT family, solute carrier family 16 (monocarboxylic acid transporters), member 10
VLPPTLSYLLPAIGLAWVLRLLAVIMAGLAMAGLLFVPPEGAPVSPKKKTLFNCEIWKNKRYVIWAFTIPLTLLGYFVPYVHMVKKFKLKKYVHQV